MECEEECGSNAELCSTPPNATSDSSTPVNSGSSEIKLSPPSARRARKSTLPDMAQMSYNPNRILGRNLNGTIAMTTQPSNESELQLYRVLQRANLLAYYDTFICQGGDDVQQLCEAGEEEFLEIMDLVGMASKPLHVRRLQKTLHEWLTKPALFQSPASAPFGGTSPMCGTGPPSVPPSSGGPSAARTSARTAPPNNNGPNQASPQITQNSPPNCGLLQQSYTGNLSTPSPSQFQNSTSVNEYGQPCSPISMTPVLMDNQIQRLAEAAEMLIKSLPPIDLKPLMNGNKKRIGKEIEHIMNMSEDDPRRMEEIRKYAAIYGRFDCKRKPEKPLTLHEVSVNEAAAQICSKMPALLYRRDELFPLARQVVRDSGYQYSKGHSRSQSCSRLFEESNGSAENSSSKRIRLESSPNQESKNFGEDRKRRHDRLEGIVDQLKSLGNKQEEIKNQIEEENERQNFQAVSQLQNELDIINNHQIELVNEKSELEKQQNLPEKAAPNNGKEDTEDTDSQFSLYSNESLPLMLQESNHSPCSNPPGANTTENTMIKQRDTFTSSKDKSGRQQSRNLASTNNNNSNDSTEFVHKQLNEAIDEGLRLAKELNQMGEDNLDMRLFNKYSEALRNPPCFGLGETNTMPNQPPRRLHKQDGSRPRGRPPKSMERDVQGNSLYEQLLTQAQMQQMHLYQAQLQQTLYAQALFGDLSLNLNPAADGGALFGTNDPPKGDTNGHNSQLDNLAKQFNNNNEMSKESESKEEMAQSLSALMAINESIKPGLGTPSVEFKIA